MAKAKGCTHIETDRCKGCGLCVVVCPLDLLTLDEKAINIKGYLPAISKDKTQCKGCGFCAMMCPDSVITVMRTSSIKRVSHA